MNASANTKANKSEDRKKLSKLIRDKARTRKIVFVLIAIVCFSLAFVLGYAFRSQVSLMSSLGLPVGEDSPLNILKTKSSIEDPSNKTVKTVYDSLSARIDEVEDIIENNGLNGDNVDSATRSAIDDLLKSTGDSYAKYFDADEYSKLLSETKSSAYLGVGITLNEVNGKCYVADVFEGSEAQAKNVKPGDAIKSIDGQNMIGKTSSEINSLINSSEGQSLIFNFFRPNSPFGDSGKDFACSLEVKKQEVENVTSTFVDDICFLGIHQFNNETLTVIQKKVDGAQNQDVRAYVIDIRNNPGGYLTGAIDCASAFVKSGTLLTIQTALSTSDKTAEGKTITDKPIVLLVNSNTSGAAEVFASALNDNLRAPVIGKITAGKGIVAATRELSFGGAVRYSAAQYITPKGNEIQGNGVKPDIDFENINDVAYDDEALRSSIESALNINLS